MSAPGTRPPTQGERRVFWILSISVLIALAATSAPVVIKQNKAAIRTKALSNIRQIGMSLFEFDSEYGSFPDDRTAPEVVKKTKTLHQLTGDFSNDYFRQLIAVGLKSEKPFWCKTSLSPDKPDDDSSPGKCLQAGEVGYSYIMATPTHGQASYEHPGSPVVVASSDGAQADWTFDNEVYGGLAVVLKLDNSATAMKIDPATRFIATGVKGRYLHSPRGSYPPWHDPSPFLRAPQPKGR
jgi:hypothetical protein